MKKLSGRFHTPSRSSPALGDLPLSWESKINLLSSSTRVKARCEGRLACSRPETTMAFGTGPLLICSVAFCSGVGSECECGNAGDTAWLEEKGLEVSVPVPPLIVVLSSNGSVRIDVGDIIEAASVYDKERE